MGVKRRGDAFNPRLKGPQPQIDKEVWSDNKNAESSIDADANQKNKAEDIETTTSVKSGSLRNQPKTTNENSQVGAQNAEPDPERKLPSAQLGQGTTVGSEGKSFGLWWPVCVLVDGPDANSQITEMVKMSAACGVNLQPYSRVVTNGFGAENDSGINNGQRSSCNLSEAGIASKGSTLFLTNKSSTVADRMCKKFKKDKETGKETNEPTTEVAGCNELANGSGTAEQQKNWKEQAGKDSKGDGFGGVAGGSVAVGIVDNEGYSSGNVYSHEAMGHGQMGWPNGASAGNGIGDPADEKKGEAIKEGSLGAYTGRGCARMRASAIPDPEEKHKYYASKTKYYNHESMSKKPLALGEPIWKRFTGGPNLAAAQPNGNPADPRGDQEADSLAMAESGHRRKKEKRLTLRKSGKRVTGSTITPNKKTEAVTRGDDNLSEQGGSQVRGGTGEGVPNDMFVANKDLSLLAKPPDNSEQLDPNFFNNDGNRSSGSNNNANPNSNSSLDSKSNSLTQVAERNSLLDSDFFSQRPNKPSELVGRKPAIMDPVTVASVPLERKKNPDKMVRALKNQVSFE